MAVTFISILTAVGTGLKDFFSVAVPVAEAAEPFVDIAFPGIGILYNSTVAAVAAAELAAAQAGAAAGTGPQKLAMVMATIGPMAVAYLATQGITASNAQITAWVNAVVASLNALPASIKAQQPVAPVLSGVA